MSPRNEQPSMSAVTNEAMIEVLEAELAEVRFLTQHGKDDQRKAAASLRVLKLQAEIEELKHAA